MESRENLQDPRFRVKDFRAFAVRTFLARGIAVSKRLHTMKFIVRRFRVREAGFRGTSSKEERRRV